MEQESRLTEPVAVGFMDLGTNSVRLLLVRVNPDLSYTILTKQKEPVRLGEGEFIDQALHPEAMRRTALVCRQFVELAHSRGVTDIDAVATSATREASNQTEFVQLLKDEAGLDIHVVSGKEEARLIYLGVSRGVHLGSSKALFIDIGGGSTETIVGSQYHYDFLETHKLGAIRLTSTFFLPDETGPVDETRYALIKNFVRNSILRTTQRLKEYPIEQVVGSSGSITNLAEIAHRHFHSGNGEREFVVSLEEIQETMRMLCRLPLAERREVPGINPYRGDIIIAGGAILETFLEDLGQTSLRTSDRGLLDGLLVDFIERHDPEHQLGELSIRERSILQFGRSVRFDEIHARNVARLALELFGQASGIGLIDLDRSDRELLKYAALLHDTGAFISYSNHHAHTYYLVRNAELLGFDEEEIKIIAATTLFHRRASPSKKHAEFAALPVKDQERVRYLSMILRLAESLDRSHAGAVRRVRLSSDGKKAVCLEILSDQDCQLEVWGVNTHLETFQKVFGKKLTVTQKLIQKDTDPA